MGAQQQHLGSYTQHQGSNGQMSAKYIQQIQQL